MTERISIAIAFTKDRRYLYIWWIDGSVSRREIVTGRMGEVEEIEVVQWDPAQFCERIPTDGNNDAF